MPNTKGGKNYKKGKKGKGKTSGKKTETPFADSPGLLYAQVKNKLGGDRIFVDCSDGVDRQAIIPGSFYKKVWINKSDIILIQLNELNTKESYILYKYDQNEAHTLKSQGLLKFELANIDDDNIQFGDDSDQSDDEDKIQLEIDQKLNDKKNKDAIEPCVLADIAKKNKIKELNIKRNNDRSGKNYTDDGEINIDDI